MGLINMIYKKDQGKQLNFAMTAKVNILENIYRLQKKKLLRNKYHTNTPML